MCVHQLQPPVHSTYALDRNGPPWRKACPTKSRWACCIVRITTTLTRVQSYEPVLFWAAEFELHMRNVRKANDKL